MNSNCLWCDTFTHDDPITPADYQVPMSNAEPTLAPSTTPSITTGSTSDGGDSSLGSGTGSMDVLAAIFFVVAAGWLFLALLYACLALFYLRMRARGELDRIYEEDFGRIHLCGRLYIPLGCLLRRYIQHIQRDQPLPSVRFMTRDERRQAMEVLLNSTAEKGAAEVKPKESDEAEDDDPRTLDDSNEEGPLCSICLGDYEHGDSLQSKTCPHQFHRDCILDWLQRQANTECPCCRVAMVSENDVWKAVKVIRRRERKEKRRNVHRTKVSETSSGERTVSPVMEQLFETGDGVDVEAPPSPSASSAGSSRQTFRESGSGESNSSAPGDV